MFHTPPVLEANQKLAGVGLPSTPSRLTGMAGAAAAGAASNPVPVSPTTVAITSADTANQCLGATKGLSAPNRTNLRAGRPGAR